MKLNHRKGLIWLGSVLLGVVITNLLPIWMLLGLFIVVAAACIYLLGAMG